MTLSRWSGALALVVLAGLAARADEDADRFARLDTNKDGVLEASEVPQGGQRLFERLLRTADKNKDGKLSLEEFVAGTKDQPPAAEERPAPREGQPRPDAARAAEIFNQIDANKDGKVTENEVPEDKREIFRRMLERLDDDGDKALTKEQFLRAITIFAQGGRPEPGRPEPGRPEARPEGRPEGARPDAPRPEGRPDAPRFAPGGGHPLMALLDVDHDGKISASEIADAPKLLATLDKNKDGEITPDELRPAGVGRVPGGGAGEADRGAYLQRMLREADKNGDGKLSKEEAPPQIRVNFDRLDANSDGQIDDAELRQLLGGRAAPPREGARPEGARPEGDRPRANGDRPRPEDNRPRAEGDRPRDPAR